jgi:hypothetical protein
LALQSLTSGSSVGQRSQAELACLYARGMTVREIQEHLAELYGTEGLARPDQPGWLPRRLDEYSATMTATDLADAPVMGGPSPDCRTRGFSSK